MSITIFNSKTKVWETTKQDNGNIFVLASTGRKSDANVALKVNVSNYAETVDENVLGNVGAPWALTSKGLRIRYTNKEMHPYAEETDVNGNDILLGFALDIEPGYRLTSFYNDQSRIFSTDIVRDDHVDFIANLTPRNLSIGRRLPRISITLVNDKTRKVISYSICARNGKVIVDVKHVNISDIPEKGQRGHISTVDFVQNAIDTGKSVVPLFCPSSPTNLVVVSQKLKGLAIKTIDERKNWSRSKHHRIEAVDNLEQLKALRKEGYTAVSLFYDREFDPRATICINNDLMYSEAIIIFDTVYLVGTNGIVSKVKVDGVSR